MADVTTKNEVIQSFHTHPMSKSTFPEGLENQFFLSALAQYELDVSSLEYDENSAEFANNIGRDVIYILGMLMYCEYLTRELSRIEKLNGFYGKDIHMTGNDTSKRVTYSDLELELKRVQERLHKKKTPAYR